MKSLVREAMEAGAIGLSTSLIYPPAIYGSEAEIAELDNEERLEFLQEIGMEEAGLDRVIRAGYELLHLQTYFTAGVKEVRAWTVKVGATAPEAAGVIRDSTDWALSPPSALVSTLRI